MPINICSVDKTYHTLLQSEQTMFGTCLGEKMTLIMKRFKVTGYLCYIHCVLDSVWVLEFDRSHWYMKCNYRPHTDKFFPVWVIKSVACSLLNSACRSFPQCELLDVQHIHYRPHTDNISQVWVIRYESCSLQALHW